MEASMLNNFLRINIFVLLFLFIEVTQASSLWTKIPSNAFPPAEAFSQIKVALNIQDILNIAQGDSFQVPVGNQVVTVTFDDFKNDNGVLFFYGYIGTDPDTLARVELIYDDGKITGYIMQNDRERGFEVDIDVSRAQGFITEYINDRLICEIPEASNSLADDADPAPGALDVFNLNSTNDRSVLYLDFNGETVSDPSWTRHTNFRTINAQPFDLEGNPNTFTGYERGYIHRIWETVSEDFKPFAINVTTSRAKFNAAPRNKRQQVVITNTNFYPSRPGGVASFNSFARNSDTVAWTFVRTFYSSRALARITSHEAGHAFNLRHDGLYGQEYHPGSGSGENYGWGPIMGAPYVGRHIQWSRGDYAGATNGQDDLAIIASKTGRRGDAYVNSRVARTKVAGTYNGYIGVGNDKDVFYVDAKKDDKLSVAVSVNETFSDLDSELSVYNSAGRLLAKKNNVAPFNKPQILGSNIN